MGAGAQEEVNNSTHENKKDLTCHNPWAGAWPPTAQRDIEEFNSRTPTRLYFAHSCMYSMLLCFLKHTILSQKRYKIIELLYLTKHCTLSTTSIAKDRAEAEIATRDPNACASSAVDRSSRFCLYMWMTRTSHAQPSHARTHDPR